MSGGPRLTPRVKGGGHQKEGLFSACTPFLEGILPGHLLRLSLYVVSNLHKLSIEHWNFLFVSEERVIVLFLLINILCYCVLNFMVFANFKKSLENIERLGRIHFK